MSVLCGLLVLYVYIWVAGSFVVARCRKLAYYSGLLFVFVRLMLAYGCGLS